MSLLYRGTVYLSSRILNTGKLGSSIGARCASTNSSGREEAVVVTDDGKTIVCWHPEPQIPYEMTMALPESPEPDTILRVQDKDAMKKLFRHNHPFFVIKELQRLTYTTKHPWFPAPGKRFAKRNPPRNREYL